MQASSYFWLISANVGTLKWAITSIRDSSSISRLRTHKLWPAVRDVARQFQHLVSVKRSHSHNWLLTFHREAFQESDRQTGVTDWQTGFGLSDKLSLLLYVLYSCMRTEEEPASEPMFFGILLELVRSWKDPFHLRFLSSYISWTASTLVWLNMHRWVCTMVHL